MIAAPRSVLLPALHWVCSVIPRKSATLPIIEHVVLRQEGDTLRLLGSRVDIEAEVSISAEGNGEAAAIPARRLLDIVRTAEDGDIRIAIDAGRVSIRAGRSHFRIASMPADDFPSMETKGIKGSVDIPADALRRLIQRTGYAMAQADVRWYLNALYLVFGTGGLQAVAANGHMLATHLEPMAAPEGKALLPAGCIPALGALAAGTEGTIQADLYEGHAVFTAGAARLSVRLVDGNYPDWQRVVPTHTNPAAIVPRSVLAAALARVKIVSEEQYKATKITFSRNALALECASPGDNNAQSEIDADYQGANFTIALNADYLDDVLGALQDTPNVLFSADPESKAVTIAPAQGDGSKAVIMQMRL